MMKIYIGTSGYNYSHWKNIFYPENLKTKDLLKFYSQHFNSVELNVTFYHTPSKETFQNWFKIVPNDFKFIVKGTRFITHIKKLKNCEVPLKVFFSNIKTLKNKLLCVLWQLPPFLKCNLKNLEDFFKLLKKFSPSCLYSFEFRNNSWFNKEVYQLMKTYKINLCIADSPYFPYEEIVTTDFLYLRFHGKESLYSSEYSESQLKNWVEKIKFLVQEQKIKFILAFFNNDAFGYAVKNALKFKELLYGNL